MGGYGVGGIASRVYVADPCFSELLRRHSVPEIVFEVG